MYIFCCLPIDNLKSVTVSWNPFYLYREKGEEKRRKARKKKGKERKGREGKGRKEKGKGKEKKEVRKEEGNQYVKKLTF